MPHDVFISYSHKDESTALAVHHALKAKGIRCWFAPNDMIASAMFAAKIISAIESSRIMVVVFSANADQSQYVETEVACAFNGKIPILQFRIDKTPPTEALKFYLTNRHWLDASEPPLEVHLERLTHDVNQLLLPIFDRDRKRSEALSRLRHELTNPLVAIRGAIDLMQLEFDDRNIMPTAFFAEDYMGDVQSYCELMKRLLDNTKLSETAMPSLRIEASLTLLTRDVVAPSIRQAGLFLTAHDIDPKQIGYGEFEQIPPLWVDKSYFQQVFFNLLVNAIKYALADPNKFKVFITGSKSGTNYLITVQDWGRGIEQNMKEMIFEEGMRGSNAEVTGQGIGLWVVRRIIEAHGGTVSVTNCYKPTELTISLPESLAKRPPR